MIDYFCGTSEQYRKYVKKQVTKLLKPSKAELMDAHTLIEKCKVKVQENDKNSITDSVITWAITGRADHLHPWEATVVIDLELMDTFRIESTNKGRLVFTDDKGPRALVTIPVEVFLFGSSPEKLEMFIRCCEYTCEVDGKKPSQHRALLIEEAVRALFKRYYDMVSSTKTITRWDVIA